MQVELYLDPREVKAVFAQIGAVQGKALWTGQANAPDKGTGFPLDGRDQEADWGYTKSDR